MSRTFIQVFSRLAIVWGAHDPLYKYPFTPFPKPKGCELTLESGPECTEERNQLVIATTLITWSIAELIRYSFYAFNTIDPKLVPFPVVWLRYSGEAVGCLPRRLLLRDAAQRQTTADAMNAFKQASSSSIPSASPGR
jgi:hypothetical protein